MEYWLILSVILNIALLDFAFSRVSRVRRYARVRQRRLIKLRMYIKSYRQLYEDCLAMQRQPRITKINNTCLEISDSFMGDAMPPLISGTPFMFRPEPPPRRGKDL